MVKNGRNSGKSLKIMEFFLNIKNVLSRRLVPNKNNCREKKTTKLGIDF